MYLFVYMYNTLRTRNIILHLVFSIIGATGVMWASLMWYRRTTNTPYPKTNTGTECSGCGEPMPNPHSNAGLQESALGPWSSTLAHFLLRLWGRSL